jgi:hypothetical protein
VLHVPVPVLRSSDPSFGLDMLFFHYIVIVTFFQYIFGIAFSVSLANLLLIRKKVMDYVFGDQVFFVIGEKWCSAIREKSRRNICILKVIGFQPGVKRWLLKAKATTG